jgi:flavorubredoxin
MARGSTDNSYVVTGGDKIALVDLPDKSYADAFSKAVDCGSIDYVVLGHLSPKRVDALAALLDARPTSSPAVEVWCSNPAAQVIYAALKPGTPASSDALAAAWKRGGLRARLRTIKSGDGLDLGGNRVLSFTTTPTPRWPDGVVTFDETSGLLFTSKLFRRVLLALVPIRPRPRGERRSLRTLPVVSLRPHLAFNARPRRL